MKDFTTQGQASLSSRIHCCQTGRFWFWMAVILLCLAGGGTRLWQNHQREVSWRQKYLPMGRVSHNTHLRLHKMLSSCRGPDLERVKSFSRAELERELNGGKPFQFVFGGGGQDLFTWTVPGSDVTFDLMFENGEWCGYSLPRHTFRLTPPPFDLFTEKVQQLFVGSLFGLGWGTGAWSFALMLCIAWRKRRRAWAELMLAFGVLYATAWLTWPDRSWVIEEISRDTTFYLAVIMLAVSAGAISWSRRITPPPWPACPTCEYNLTGNTSHRCPECGQDV